MIATVVLGFALLSLFGLAVVSVVEPSRRAFLFPALPLIGAAFLVVVLHITGLFLPVSIGVWIAAALAVAALAIAIGRQRSLRFVPIRAVVEYGVAVAVGVPGAVLGLLPSLLARSPLAIQPNASNDANYYVSVIDWLIGHPFTRVPDIGTNPVTGADSPAFGSAQNSIISGLRLGQELVQAALDSVTGLHSVATFSPWLGLWVLLVPGAIWVLGAAFALKPVWRAGIGLVAVTSFSLVNQVLTQNADSLLGIALLPLVIAVIIVVIESTRAERRAPLWLAALLLAALVGTYTEYLPFLAIVLVLIVLVRPPRQIWPAMLRAVTVLGLSMVMGAVIWYRAVQNLLLVAGVASTGAPVPVSAGRALARLLGPYEPVLVPGPGPAHPLLERIELGLIIAGVTLGILAAIVGKRSRGLAIGTIVSAVVVAYIAYRGNDYSAGRGAGLVTPLAIAVAGIGWAGIHSWLKKRSKPTTALTFSVVAAGLAVLCAFFGVKVTNSFTVDEQSNDQIVTNDYAEAAAWVSGLGSGDGSSVAVATNSLFQQLWVAQALRDVPDVSYVSLRGDLGYRSSLSQLSYWNQTPERFVLVGSGAYADYDPSAVTEQNSTFTLIDLSKSAVVAVPVVVQPSWSYIPDAAGATFSQATGAVQLFSGVPDLARYSLEVTGLNPGEVIEVRQNGTVISSTTAISGEVDAPLAGTGLTDSLARVTVSVNTTTGGPFALGGIHHD
ncbi:hypothetical protein [Subtercola frigoramans]|uniref:Glycosyltransferase RgtA/B/C/D-like domain-containing protein n=1 Tax=Subtercola frigoramans TaxID=120298 RepID=A0ABS2L872_9MICO|nr:hypothetical protein [Subtercola frigoramans]MBM7473297.1 hypothetical protein [Subtercola frigoramans]